MAEDISSDVDILLTPTHNEDSPIDYFNDAKKMKNFNPLANFINSTYVDN